MSQPLFNFKSEEIKQEIKNIGNEISIDYSFLNKKDITKEEIILEMERCNKNIETIQRYKEAIYNNLIFIW